MCSKQWRCHPKFFTPPIYSLVVIVLNHCTTRCWGEPTCSPSIGFVFTAPTCSPSIGFVFTLSVLGQTRRSAPTGVPIFSMMQWKMIGHYHHFVAMDIGKFIFQFIVPFFNLPSRIIQYHFGIGAKIRADTSSTNHCLKSVSAIFSKVAFWRCSRSILLSKLLRTVAMATCSRSGGDFNG